MISQIKFLTSSLGTLYRLEVSYGCMLLEKIVIMDFNHVLIHNLYLLHVVLLKVTFSLSCISNISLGEVFLTQVKAIIQIIYQEVLVHQVYQICLPVYMALWDLKAIVQHPKLAGLFL